MCKLPEMAHVLGSMEEGRNQATTILVTPVWKDSVRLRGFGRELADELAKRESQVKWIIADDGSGFGEKEALQRLCRDFEMAYPDVRVHFAPKHFGKGSVVREAWALEPEAAAAP